MGFLDNLVRRVVSSAVDTAVDSVMNSVLGKNEQSEGDGTASETGSSGGGDPVRENKKATRQANNSGEILLRQRIEEAAARELPQYELRQRIPVSQVNAPEGAKPYFDYGFYRDGLLVAVINILDDNNAYCRKSVCLAQQACRDRQVAYMNFMSYMMNRPEYISQRLQKHLK